MNSSAEEVEGEGRRRARLILIIIRVREIVRRAEHRFILRVTTLGHLAYYGLVSVEAHGHYRYAAGALGVLLILEAFAGSGVEPNE